MNSFKTSEHTTPESTAEILNQSERQRDIRKNNSDFKSQVNLHDGDLTKIDQKPAVELSGRPRRETAEVGTVVKSERSVITDCRQTDQLQNEETQSDLEVVQLSEHAARSPQKNNFNQSDGSLRMKQIWKDYEKRIKFNLGSIEESPTNARNSQQHERPYVCEECGYASKYVGHLNRHKKTHLDERPYVCKECGYASRYEKDLNRHKIRHLGTKPFVCTKCDFACNDPSNLRRHERNHSDEKPFICHICKEAFRRKIHLSRHMDTHSGKSFHKCNECQKEFRLRSNLSKHLKTHSKIQL